MNATKIKGVRCPHCDEVIEQVDIEKNTEDFYRCSECDQVYEDKDEARDCCKE